MLSQSPQWHKKNSKEQVWFIFHLFPTILKYLTPQKFITFPDTMELILMNYKSFSLTSTTLNQTKYL